MSTGRASGGSGKKSADASALEMTQAIIDACGVLADLLNGSSGAKRARVAEIVGSDATDTLAILTQVLADPDEAQDRLDVAEAAHSAARESRQEARRGPTRASEVAASERKAQEDEDEAVMREAERKVDEGYAAIARDYEEANAAAEQGDVGHMRAVVDRMRAASASGVYTQDETDWTRLMDQLLESSVNAEPQSRDMLMAVLSLPDQFPNEFVGVLQYGTIKEVMRFILSSRYTPLAAELRGVIDNNTYRDALAEATVEAQDADVKAFKFGQALAKLYKIDLKGTAFGKYLP